MKILHLTLKKKWFELIASGEKREEYREMKEYWWQRLTEGQHFDLRNFDVVRFRNGYAKDAPTMDVKCEGLRIGQGRGAWGAELGVTYFVIELGEVLK